MNAFEIIQLLTKGLVPVDRCGTGKFETSDLLELTQLFGPHYCWSGHMFKGNVFFVFNTFNDAWTIEDADLIGTADSDEFANVYVFHVGD